jgi:hypothetical protein
MFYTIIAEPRSGGTSLMYWFEKVFPNFTNITEPYTNMETGWVDVRDPMQIDWLNQYDDVVLKEIYEYDYNFKNLINKSDKVICLYRENWFAQIKSLLYLEYRDKFTTSYSIEEVNSVITKEDIVYRYRTIQRERKRQFQEFIKENDFFAISYESLYFSNGIKTLKDYLGIQTDIQFPVQKRYLKTENGEEFGKDSYVELNDATDEFFNKEVEELHREVDEVRKKLIKDVENFTTESHKFIELFKNKTLPKRTVI